MGDAMRDIVLFIDVPDSGSAALYHRAARSLDLVPVLVTESPSGGSDVAAGRLHVPKIALAEVLSAIDRIGRERVAGVFTCASVGAELAARLAAALGRPHADPEAISLCNDKHRLRAFLERKGLNTVPYRHVTTVSDARRAAESLGGAVVVKPVFSTGSDGVRVCRNCDEAISHVETLLKRKSDGVVIEKYIDGPMFAVELFDGKALVVKRNFISKGPFPITIGTDTPASLQNELCLDIKNYAASIIKVVGIASGPSALQLSASGVDKYLIEINPRPFLQSTIDTFIATNINMAALCLKFSCGIPYTQEFFVSQKNRACATRYVVRNGSSVRAINRVAEARKLPGVKSVHITDSRFDRRGPATSAFDRIATVHSEADTIEEAAACAELALSKLTVVYDRFPVDLFKYYSRKLSLSWIKLLRNWN